MYGNESGKMERCANEGINKIGNRVIRLEIIYKICVEGDVSIKRNLKELEKIYKAQDEGDKIKFIAEIACVNYLMAKQVLEKEKVCILKAKAPKIKETISKLQEKNFEFCVTPSFIY